MYKIVAVKCVFEGPFIKIVPGTLKKMDETQLIYDSLTIQTRSSILVQKA